MQGIANHAESAAIVSLMLLAITIVATVAYYSARHGRKTLLRRSLFAILTLLVISMAVSYLLAAQMRARISTSKCARSVSPDSQYVARTCYSGDRTVLRVLTKDESSLLAERTFADHGDDPVKIFWQQDRLEYDDGNDGVHLSAINLPPTLLDRALANLP